MEHAPPISQDLIRKQEMDKLLAKSTPERRAIFEKLREKQWFRSTDFELQKKLVSLPDTGKENHDGFLADLAGRPEEIANIKVERMVDLPHGSFVLVPKFEVSRVDNPNIRYTYEYASWRYGPLSGAKGVVFVEDQGKTTHFVVIRGEKFATGKPQFDSFGGFYDKGSDGVHNITDRMLKEIREELGSRELEIRKFEHLGSVHPDAGMTNQAPELYAAVISVDDLKKLPSSPVNADVYELKQGPVVFPMDQLPEVVMTNSDGYFLSTIARAWAKGIIAPPHALSGKSVDCYPR